MSKRQVRIMASFTDGKDENLRSIAHLVLRLCYIQFAVAHHGARRRRFAGGIETDTRVCQLSVGKECDGQGLSRQVP